MEEIQDLSRQSRQIDLNNLTYHHYEDKSVPKNFIVFKGPQDFFKNIKEGYVTLEKAEEKQK